MSQSEDPSLVRSAAERQARTCDIAQPGQLAKEGFLGHMSLLDE